MDLYDFFTSDRGRQLRLLIADRVDGCDDVGEAIEVLFANIGFVEFYEENRRYASRGVAEEFEYERLCIELDRKMHNEKIKAEAARMASRGCCLRKAVAEDACGCSFGLIAEELDELRESERVKARERGSVMAKKSAKMLKIRAKERAKADKKKAREKAEADKKKAQEEAEAEEKKPLVFISVHMNSDKERKFGSGAELFFKKRGYRVFDSASVPGCCEASVRSNICNGMLDKSDYVYMKIGWSGCVEAFDQYARAVRANKKIGMEADFYRNGRIRFQCHDVQMDFPVSE